MKFVYILDIYFLNCEHTQNLLEILFFIFKLNIHYINGLYKLIEYYSSVNLCNFIKYI